MQGIRYSLIGILCITSYLHSMTPEYMQSIWITAAYALSQPEFNLSVEQQSKKKVPKKKTYQYPSPKKQKPCQRKWSQTNRVHQPRRK